MGQPSRLDELRRRVRQDPASIAFAALAEEYRRQGLLGDAIDLCRAGLARHPTYILGRVTLARALFDSGDTDAAIIEFEHVLRIAPDNLAALRGLAEAHAERGEIGAALDRLRAAAAFAPQDAALRARMGELEAALGPTADRGGDDAVPASGPPRAGGMESPPHAAPAVLPPESAGEPPPKPDSAVEPFWPPPAPLSLDSDDAQGESEGGRVAPPAETDAAGDLDGHQPDKPLARPDAAVADGAQAVRETASEGREDPAPDNPASANPQAASAVGLVEETASEPRPPQPASRADSVSTEPPRAGEDGHRANAAGPMADPATLVWGTTADEAPGTPGGALPGTGAGSDTVASPWPATWQPTELAPDDATGTGAGDGAVGVVARPAIDGEWTDPTSSELDGPPELARPGGMFDQPSDPKPWEDEGPPGLAVDNDLLAGIAWPEPAQAVDSRPPDDASPSSDPCRPHGPHAGWSESEYTGAAVIGGDGRVEPENDAPEASPDVTVSLALADASDATAGDPGAPDGAISVDAPASAPPDAGLSERAFDAAADRDDVSDSGVTAPAPSAWDLSFPQHGSAAGPFFDSTETTDLAPVGGTWDLGLPDAPPEPGLLAGGSLSPIEGPAPAERVADCLGAASASGNGDGPTPIAAPHTDGIPSDRRAAALRTLERWLEALERARTVRSNPS